MKKAAIILMGICLCLSIPVAAEAAQTGTSLRSKAPSTRQYRIPTWSRYDPNMHR